jgi:hypothetical protein
VKMIFFIKYILFGIYDNIKRKKFNIIYNSLIIIIFQKRKALLVREGFPRYVRYQI